ncbi:60S ribosomal protein L5 [Dionaea muscipula]
MASSSPSLMHLNSAAAASSFRGLYAVAPFSASTTVFFPHSRTKVRRSVRVTAVIPTVDKSDSEKVHRLKTAYIEKITPLLKDEFGYTNVHEVPKIEKVVVNCGMGDASQNSKGLEVAIKELARITGQRPVKTEAKKSIAGFKLRAGQPVGIKVTLRKDVMYSFLDRFINLALPRVRDFQGVNPNSFDGHGNFSVGFREQSIFPEIQYDVINAQRGMDVCITTTAKTDKEAYRLLALMGMPFKEGSGPVDVERKKKKRYIPMKGKWKGKWKGK